jgi:hypothetical protein
MAQLPQEIFTDRAEVINGINSAAQVGYAFVHAALTETMLSALQAEGESQNLVLGDHTTKPINAGTLRQITQKHEKAYKELDAEILPVASFLTSALATQAKRLQEPYPALAHWRATEAGYQLYSDPDHHISKHRDRRKDQILAATVTIYGKAIVGIHEPLDDPNDYTNTQRIDECEAGPGTLMFLRAQNLGSGEQMIHDVSPPIDGPRLILNLRMRPDVLPQTG